ncbi:hypothetical protein GOP47_0019883 [Adiantum capillus-veneris]|uniref:Uncharacterized protein n=1 Tax=Adiantum capillus-veneris TaxID=13818 RepID=A0A9D4UBX0_ADICA|nr:hypothetical protein GOP47_0019883 [Adiantum capillus-veneris]
MKEAASPADPRAFLQALGARPDPSAVQTAQLMLLHLESDLSSKLASLSNSPDQAEEVAKLREEAEKAKLPYKSIVSLFELHQIYEGLTRNVDERTRKTLEELNSFTERRDIFNREQEPDARMLIGTIDLSMLEAWAAKDSPAKMDLSGRLIQTLPTSFGDEFVNLVSLDLSRNQLKNLPGSIGELENLEVLDLQSNQLSMLPDAIGLLMNLKVLNVSGNMLVALPESLGGCRKLVELNAGFNQLAHISPRFGYDFSYLENLCLHSNKLTFLPPSVGKLKRLKVLDLHFNNIKSLPSSLGNLLSLEKLNLSNNFSDFGGMLPESIGDLIFLTELDLSFNQIRVLPDSVGALENLKVLKVENNPLVVPPLDVVEHSMEALLEYMSVRWKTSETYSEDEVCASPRAMSLKGGMRSPFAGISLAHWVSGRSCSGRNSVSLRLYHKQLKPV